MKARNVLNPSAVVKDGKVHLIYRAQDQKMTSRIALATSEDGIHFTKEAAPIFFPDNDAYVGLRSLWRGRRPQGCSGSGMGNTTYLPIPLMTEKQPACVWPALNRFKRMDQTRPCI